MFFCGILPVSFELALRKFKFFVNAMEIDNLCLNVLRPHYLQKIELIRSKYDMEDDCFLGLKAKLFAQFEASIL
mgnify:CR=1 FL=1